MSFSTRWIWCIVRSSARSLHKAISHNKPQWLRSHFVNGNARTWMWVCGEMPKSRNQIFRLKNFEKLHMNTSAATLRITFGATLVRGIIQFTGTLICKLTSLDVKSCFEFNQEEQRLGDPIVWKPYCFQQALKVLRLFLYRVTPIKCWILQLKVKVIYKFRWPDRRDFESY